MTRRPPRSTRTYTLFPYTTLFRSDAMEAEPADLVRALSDNPSERLNHAGIHPYFRWQLVDECGLTIAPSAPMAPGHIDRWMVYDAETLDRKSTRLNSSH